jgi:hypothetical protein
MFVRAPTLISGLAADWMKAARRGGHDVEIPIAASWCIVLRVVANPLRSV